MREITMNEIVPEGLEQQMKDTAIGYRYKTYRFSVLITVKENGLLYVEHLYQVRVSIGGTTANIAVKVVDENNTEVFTWYINSGASTENNDKWVEPIVECVGNSLLLFNKGLYCTE